MESDASTVSIAAPIEPTSAASRRGRVSATTGASRGAVDPVASGTDTAPRYMQARSMVA